MTITDAIQAPVCEPEAPRVGYSDWPQEPVAREIRSAPDRYRNALGKYKVDRSAACAACGRCTEACRYGVHYKPAGYAFVPRPADQFCIGPDCAETPESCVNQCPRKALTVRPNPSAQCMGDARWPPDLILSTWHQAATGRQAPAHLESRTGASGGGFDNLRFKFEVPGLAGESACPTSGTAGGNACPTGGTDASVCQPGVPGWAGESACPTTQSNDDIETGLDLNHRGDGRPQIHIDLPVYGGGMSFGSVSIHTILGKARAAVAWNTFTCTGEGGYHDRLRPYDDHVITQVATGLFGVREDTIQRVRIVEFKYAQGAKPGLGGHLLGDKNTPAVARMREAVAGNALFSPFPFHSVYSVEDHKKHVDWIKEVNHHCLVSVKVSTPTDVDMVAVGSYYAGAHIIHLDGSYGGTGAAPDIAKKNIAMPIEYAVPKVHKFLVAEGIRDKVTLIASGGIRTAYDALKTIALGADGVVVGTVEMVALGCVRCACCESGRGCPRGIASTDPELMMQVDLDWATRRLINLNFAWREQMVDALRRLGMKSIRELRGRTDTLCYVSDDPVSGEVTQ
jgi:glutamate synthase domain-containing protein 2/ferredoxin